MMKRISSSKPISSSSPGRTDKFPPPLMRFLRSNAGSRSSRARSRASPMFVRKKSINRRHKTSTTTKTTTTEATQEPSSPKVTCMGQVRIKRSSKQSGSNRRRKRTPAKCRCRWFPTPGFCGQKIKLKSFRLRPHFENWLVFFHIRKDESFKKNGSVREENGSSFNNKYEEKEEDQEKEEADTNFHDPPSSAPPKNALLLTRCRSAPYRSSSLACRFWGSPLSNTTEETTEQKTIDQADEENNGELEDSTSSIDDHPVECGKIEEIKAGEVVESQDRPVNIMLTRCKSEPARTGNKLDPEGVFWRQRKFGDGNGPNGNGFISESKSPQVCD